jgi:hypothetical protein
LKDLKFIQGLLKELDANIEKWDSEKVLDKANDIFDAFHKRFALEDISMRYIIPTPEMKVELMRFLKIRRKFREDLESLLMMNVDEPDFRTGMNELLAHVTSHLVYLTTNFEPRFFDKIIPEQMSAMSGNLEKRLRIMSFR